MFTKINQAVQLYNQAHSAEEAGKAYIAEVYYLKSWVLFEQAGENYCTHAAHALNALAQLRRSYGNFEGALVSAKKSVQIIESHPELFASDGALVIRRQAWELVKELLTLQEPQQRFSPVF